MPRLSLKYQYFAANLAILWLAVLYYRTNHYYLSFLSERTRDLILWLALGYTVAGAAFYAWSKEPEPTHAYNALVAARRWLRSACQHLSRLRQGLTLPLASLSRAETTSLLFLLLKLIYLPMMFEFMTSNWHSLAARWWCYSRVWELPRAEAFNDFLFPCLIDVFFTAECALYAFGYAVESPRCRNVIKSVDHSLLGWAVALACYPPFNGFVNNYVSWYTSDEPKFLSPSLTIAARIIVLVVFAIYLIGALSLGTKCSNLTNRGIVSTGAFAYVRHPAYAAKNLAWWIGILPVLSVPAVLSMAFWSFIYFLRAVTEERHLMNDPAYQAYCKKVPHRFIPGVF